ncbi:MAG: PAS domain-containing protein [Paracoccaceae bacterium]|nr:MAG: PAS domain-containing protein [Paracoccaceae bacterium]
MVTSFFGGSGRRSVAADAIFAELRGYWQGQIGPDGLPPLRSVIDPRGIAGTLDCAFIADRVAPGVARFRLAGAAIADLLGMDVRGMPMLSLIDPPARAGFGRIVEEALMRPAELQMDLEADRGIGRPALSGSVLMLPLRRADGSGGLALGCLVSDGSIGRPPRRFAIARHRLTPMDVTVSAAAPAPGMAEDPAPFHPRGERPYLRLVKTDRPAS